MKILFLTNNDSGLIQFRKELLEELVKEHTVICCTPNEDGYINKIEEIGCRCIVFNFNRTGKSPFHDAMLYVRYVRLIKQIKPEIVFTYTIKPNVYGGMACRTTKTPYVANITGLGTSIENGGLLQRISLVLYRIGLKGAQNVYFQNMSNKEFMIKRRIVGNNNSLLPGSGVNLEYFQYCPYPRDSTINFLFAARVMKEKGIDQYLEAAKAIRAKYPNTRFHICGTYEQDYKIILDELSKEEIIIYHGMIEDMRSMYELASCIIHPSYYPEGLSNVLLEGAASGRPIITTNRPGCKEVIDDGINGYVIKQQDSADLIKKIEEFINLCWEERMKMGLAGRTKVEREFDRKIVVKSYMKEIRKVIK